MATDSERRRHSGWLLLVLGVLQAPGLVVLLPSMGSSPLFWVAAVANLGCLFGGAYLLTSAGHEAAEGPTEHPPHSYEAWKAQRDAADAEAFGD